MRGRKRGGEGVERRARCCQPPLVGGRGKKERPSARRCVREGSKPRSRDLSSEKVRRGGKREGLLRKEVVERRKKKVDGRGRSLSDSVPKTGVFGRNRVGNRRQHGVVIRRPLAAATRWRPVWLGWCGCDSRVLACGFVRERAARRRAQGGSIDVQCIPFTSDQERSRSSTFALRRRTIAQRRIVRKRPRANHRPAGAGEIGSPFASALRFGADSDRIRQGGRRETDLERHHDLCECLFAQRPDLDEQEAVKKRTESGESATRSAGGN